jgi:hypothetical protein
MFDPAQAYPEYILVCGPPPMARNRWPAADSPQPMTAGSGCGARFWKHTGNRRLCVFRHLAVEEFLQEIDIVMERVRHLVGDIQVAIQPVRHLVFDTKNTWPVVQSDTPDTPHTPHTCATCNARAGSRDAVIVNFDNVGKMFGKQFKPVKNCHHWMRGHHIG